MEFQEYHRESYNILLSLSGDVSGQLSLVETIFEAVPLPSPTSLERYVDNLDTFIPIGKEIRPWALVDGGRR